MQAPRSFCKKDHLGLSVLLLQVISVRVREHCPYLSGAKNLCFCYRCGVNMELGCIWAPFKLSSQERVFSLLFPICGRAEN